MFYNENSVYGEIKLAIIKNSSESFFTAFREQVEAAYGTSLEEAIIDMEKDSGTLTGIMHLAGWERLPLSPSEVSDLDDTLNIMVGSKKLDHVVVYKKNGAKRGVQQ